MGVVSRLDAIAVSCHAPHSPLLAVPPVIPTLPSRSVQGDTIARRRCVYDLTKAVDSVETRDGASTGDLGEYLGDHLGEYLGDPERGGAHPGRYIYSFITDYIRPARDPVRGGAQPGRRGQGSRRHGARLARRHAPLGRQRQGALPPSHVPHLIPPRRCFSFARLFALGPRYTTILGARHAARAARAGRGGRCGGRRVGRVFAVDARCGAGHHDEL